MKILWNAVNMMSITVIKIELREDGESLVFHTMLWEGFSRKFVVNIRDICKHREPEQLKVLLHESYNARDQFNY